MKKNSTLVSLQYWLLVVVTFSSISLTGCSGADSSKGSTKGNVTERMQLVVDNLVTSYNTLDSENFRRHLGAKLLVENPLVATGRQLRDSQQENGRIERVDIDASADGHSAGVTFHFEKRTFESNIKLDFDGRVISFDWPPKS